MEYYYYNPSGGTTWGAAEAYCVSEYSGHLASFHSAAEYTAVMAGLENLYGFVPYGWIGLTDAAQEGTFVWSDGSVVDWTNWYPGEPSSGGGQEDCVGNTDGGLLFTWNVHECSSTSTAFTGTSTFVDNGAICKRPGAVVR